MYLPCSLFPFPYIWFSLTAKNLALAGVKSLTLCDPKPISMPELSSQFYFGEGDVGKNRAEVLFPFHVFCS